MSAEALNATLRRLAERYARVAEEVLGENLVSLALFGSVARGEAGPESDIDLFLVCRTLPRGMPKRHRFLEPIRARLQEELEELWREGVYADFTELPYTQEEARHFHWVYLDMLEDAVILVDRGDFLKGVLEDLRRKLEKLGARRHTLGRVRYWVLKENLRPGEEIQL